MRLDEARTLNPGILRHQITFQRKAVSGQNSFGEDVYAWVDLATVKAQVKGLTGKEKEAAGQRWAEAQYRITMHYYRGLDHAERIAWFVDGVVRYLDLVDFEDAAGTGRVHVLFAKEWAA